MGVNIDLMLLANIREAVFRCDTCLSRCARQKCSEGRETMSQMSVYRVNYVLVKFYRLRLTCSRREGTRCPWGCK